MSSDDMIGDTKNLRSAVMNDDWAEVLKMFKEKRDLRTAKITETGDTVLHIAVSKQNVDVVESMVDLVCGKKNNEHDVEQGDERKLVLEAKNEKGNTPLHLAISLLGFYEKRERERETTERSVRMCKKIGSEYPSLFVARNNTGETPLFLAALHGKIYIFLWLHYLHMGSSKASPTEFAHCIRDNDDTILHCAIAGGHIDVAIEIVHLYKNHLKELMRCNKEGLSPLHLLAAQPSFFKSCWLRPIRHPLKRAIYCAIYGRLRPKQKNQATTLEELRSGNLAGFAKCSISHLLIPLL